MNKDIKLRFRKMNPQRLPFLRSVIDSLKVEHASQMVSINSGDWPYEVRFCLIHGKFIFKNLTKGSKTQRKIIA